MSATAAESAIEMVSHELAFDLQGEVGGDASVDSRRADFRIWRRGQAQIDSSVHGLQMDLLHVVERAEICGDGAIDRGDIQASGEVTKVSLAIHQIRVDLAVNLGHFKRAVYQVNVIEASQARHM